MKQYTVDGVKYNLPDPDNVILAQSEQLTNLIKGNAILDREVRKLFGKNKKKGQEIDLVGLVMGAMDLVSELLAVILTKEGTKLKDKNLQELAETFRYTISTQKAVEIIYDFFMEQGLGKFTPKETETMKTQKKPEKKAKN